MAIYRNYVMASSLAEAYELNQKKTNQIIAGNGWLKMLKHPRQTMIDLANLGLDYIKETDEEFRIGAMTTLSEVENCISLNEYTNNMFKNAFKPIVGVQFRNSATIGGSVWSRFGFSDVISALLVLDTRVVLFNKGEVLLSDFVKSNYDNDILVELIIRKEKISVSYEAFRNQVTDLPVLTTAVAQINDTLRIVVGARPQVASVLTINKDEFNLDEIVKNFSFASNMRASQTYREGLCKVLIKRNLERLGVNNGN